MNPFISLLNNRPSTTPCPGAQASPPAKTRPTAQPSTGDAGVSPAAEMPAVVSPTAQPNSPALAGRGQGRGQQAGTPAHPDNKTPIKFAKYLIPAAVIILLLIWLSSCKSPATLTSDTQHRARDSTRHTTIHRIETHDTIVIRPSKSPLKGDFGYSPFKGEPERVLLRISDRTITLQDTVYICRTDTLLRTQTITEKERYIPPFYRFCTITFATFATFATLAFSIHLLLRYLKTR